MNPPISPAINSGTTSFCAPQQSAPTAPNPPPTAPATPRPAPHAPPAQATLPTRLAILTYGLICYTLSLLTFAYTAGWILGVGNLTPTTLDARPLPTDVPPLIAIVNNLFLILVFAAQHSIMARPWFKRQWTRIVPPAAERSTYVLFSCLAMAALFWLWQPLGGVLWDIHSTPARTAIVLAYAFGWALLLTVTFLINHFDLFGLRQVWLFFRQRNYTPLPFKTPLLYRAVRHPLYIGWLTIFWAAPTMTITHLLFALLTTAYILLAIRWEERDLAAAHPEYLQYQNRVGMLIPRPQRKET